MNDGVPIVLACFVILWGITVEARLYFARKCIEEIANWIKMSAPRLNSMAESLGQLPIAEEVK